MVALVSLTLACCSGPQPPGIRANLPTLQLATSPAVLNHVIDAALVLDAAVVTFLDAPGDNSQKVAQDAWLTCHDRWLLTHVDFMFNVREAVLLEYQVAAWPITPGYIDSQPDYPHSGIVHDLTLPVNADNLREQHGFSDPDEVALGLHVIEYLLFKRPLFDFDPGLASDTQSAEIVLRRRTLLRLAAEMAVADLQASAAGIPASSLPLADLLHASVRSLSAAEQKLIHAPPGVDDAQGSNRQAAARLVTGVINRVLNPAHISDHLVLLDADMAEKLRITLASLKQNLDQPALPDDGVGERKPPGDDSEVTARRAPADDAAALQVQVARHLLADLASLSRSG